MCWVNKDWVKWYEVLIKLSVRQQKKMIYVYKQNDPDCELMRIKLLKYSLGRRFLS